MTSNFEKYGIKVSKWILILFGIYMLFSILGGYVIIIVLLIIWQSLKK